MRAHFTAVRGRSRLIGIYSIVVPPDGSDITFLFGLGESTAGQGSGILGNGVTCSSVAVSQGDKPTGADSLTFGSPSVFSTTTYVHGNSYGAGEGFSVVTTFAGDQTAGEYHIVIIPTLSNGDTGPLLIAVCHVREIPS